MELIVTLKEEGTIPFRSQKSTSKVFTKCALGFPLNIMWNRFETLITYWVNEWLGLIKILYTRVSIGQSLVSISRTLQNLNFSFCSLYVLDSWLVSPWALSNQTYRLRNLYLDKFVLIIVCSDFGLQLCCCLVAVAYFILFLSLMCALLGKNKIILFKFF